MNTPLVEQTFSITHDIRDSSRRVASFFIDPSICRNVCARCEIRKWKDQPYRLMTEETFAKELIRYSLMNIQLIVFRGGDISNRGSLRSGGMSLENIVRVARKVAPVCVWTNGSNPDVIGSLKPYVDGFRIDIKLPLFDKFSEEDKAIWEPALGYKKGVETYVHAVERSIELVDGMPETYYTSSSWRDMDDRCQTVMRQKMCELNSPFIVKMIALFPSLGL